MKDVRIKEIIKKKTPEKIYCLSPWTNHFGYLLIQKVYSLQRICPVRDLNNSKPCKLLTLAIRESIPKAPLQQSDHPVYRIALVARKLKTRLTCLSVSEAAQY